MRIRLYAGGRAPTKAMLESRSVCKRRSSNRMTSAVYHSNVSMQLFNDIRLLFSCVRHLLLAGFWSSIAAWIVRNMETIEVDYTGMSPANGDRRLSSILGQNGVDRKHENNTTASRIFTEHLLERRAPLATYRAICTATQRGREPVSNHPGVRAERSGPLRQSQRMMHSTTPKLLTRL